MNNKHRRTRQRVFMHPTCSDLTWREVEGLFRALGAEVTEGAGSRVRVALGAERAIFHKPHPQKEISKSMVKDIRDFLTLAGA